MSDPDPYSIERPEVDAIRRALGFQASLIRTREHINDPHLTNVVKDGLNAALDMADRITELEARIAGMESPREHRIAEAQRQFTIAWVRYQDEIAAAFGEIGDTDG